MTTLAQSKFENENVKVSFGNNLESNKITINLSQGTWNVILFPLFTDNQIIDDTFPNESGIYRLTISYADELFYSEIVLYKMNPKNEKLSFHFHQNCDRIFCQMASEEAQELNKEIVLNKISNEFQEILKKSHD